MTTHSAIYVGDNSHLIELIGLQDNDGAVQTNATVQLTALVDARTGTTVTGAGLTLPLTMPHISVGTYRAQLPPALSIVAGRTYLATVKATGSQGFKGEWTETLIAQRRAA